MPSSEARLRGLFEGTNTGIAMVTPDGMFLDVNPAFCDLVGLPHWRLLQMGFDDLTHPDDRADSRAVFHRMLIGETPSLRIQKRYIRADGEVLWVDVSATLLRDEQGVPLHTVATVQDITAERAARQALLDREARLAQQAALLDAARDAIIVRDIDHHVTYVNPAAQQLYGWSAEELLGRSTRDLYPDPSDFDAAFSAVMLDGEWQGELHLRHRDGRPLVVDSRWTLVRDAAGRASSVLVIDTDVTERTELRAQLLRTQRLESLGTLAGGIAHDLNNVLTPIMMSIDLLRSAETDPVKLEVIDMIAGSTRRGAEVVRQILTFARGVEGERTTVDVDRLLGDVARIAEDTFLKSIRVVHQQAPGLWPVLGDATQLHQVILNLCVNARDAMPDGGTLRLAADAVVVDRRYAALGGDASPGRYVRILVEDDGVGMPPEIVDHIFEPFFTTKPKGQGTGLGLSVSSSIVASHHGFLRVDSRPGRGTRFLVHLPAADVPAASGLEPATAPLPVGAGQLVVVIDDEAQIRSILRHTLEAFGYRVAEADGGDAALDLLATHDGEVAVVVTDMTMPGMDGPATIRALRRLRPDLPVIAASGLYGEDVVDPDALDVQRFLPKPYSVSALLQAVHELVAAD